MEISSEVEPLVRDALNACVHKDERRLETAVKAFPDEDALLRGVQLTTAVAIAAVVDSFQGVPTDESVRGLAKMIAEMEEWAGLNQDVIYRFLESLLGRPGAPPLAQATDPQAPVVMSFVITASLLSASNQKRESEFWYDYLDRLEAQLEAESS